MNAPAPAIRGSAARVYDSLPMFCHSVADDAGMSLGARAVYMHLTRRAGRDGRCFPSQQSIGDICFPHVPKPDSRRRAAMRAVKELAELGFIEKKQRGRGPHGSRSNDYKIVSLAKVQELHKPKHGLKVLSAKSNSGDPWGCHVRRTHKVLPSLTADPAIPSSDRESTVGDAGLDRPYGEAAKSKLLQGAHAATVVAYPDKVPSAPDLTDKPNEYIQPYVRPEFFEFEQPCQEEGSVPLWDEFDQQDETIAPPEPERLDTTNQPPLVPKDRTKKEKKVPPRARQKSQHALNRAYTFDAAGWLQLPEANGLNSVARAIAVRVMQEILLADHGESIDVFWEQDDEGNWLVLDAKHDCEAGSLDAMFGSKGRLTLGKLRDCCAGFSGVSQEEFNRDLQMLYGIALEFCEAGGVLGRLDYGERWIDQELFAEYLENWL
jgi:hypothetical protein